MLQVTKKKKNTKLQCEKRRATQDSGRAWVTRLLYMYLKLGFILTICETQIKSLNSLDLNFLTCKWR
jgi:hypothetical protein